jgi:acetyl esterase/lipase
MSPLPLLSLLWCLVAVGAPLRDLAYGPGPHARLDVHPGAGPNPDLLVFVHGGSWVGGSKDNVAKAPALVPWLQRQGFTVVVPEFRAAAPGEPGGATWADQLDDLADALAWVEAHPAEVGATGEGAVLVGYSSGAHLVALLGARPERLEARGLPADHVRATVSLDVHAYDVPLALALMRGSVVQRNIPHIEGLFGETPEEQLAASPSVDAGRARVAPSLLVSVDSTAPGQHGDVAGTASAVHAARLRAGGHVAEHRHFEQEDHGSLVLDLGRPGDGPTAAVEGVLAEVRRGR